MSPLIGDVSWGHWREYNMGHACTPIPKIYIFSTLVLYWWKPDWDCPLTQIVIIVGLSLQSTFGPYRSVVYTSEKFGGERFPHLVSYTACKPKLQKCLCDKCWQTGRLSSYYYLLQLHQCQGSRAVSKILGIRASQDRMKMKYPSWLRFVIYHKVKTSKQKSYSYIHCWSQ